MSSFSASSSSFPRYPNQGDGEGAYTRSPLHLDSSAVDLHILAGPSSHSATQSLALSRHSPAAPSHSWASLPLKWKAAVIIPSLLFLAAATIVTLYAASAGGIFQSSTGVSGDNQQQQNNGGNNIPPAPPSPPPSSPAVTYDTSIGMGVDGNGFAALPLKPGMVEGPNLLLSAPQTVATAITWDASSLTLSSLNPTAQSPLATWRAVFTAGSLYHLKALYTTRTYAYLRMRDESGQTQLMIDAVGNALPPKTYLIDALFNATGSDCLFDGVYDTFDGSLQILTLSLLPTGGQLPGRVYFVNPSIGSDRYNALQAQSPLTPLATMRQAREYVEPGRADQLLVAEGSIINETFPYLAGKDGHSAAYPTVISSYDPFDAFNASKYGRGEQRALGRPQVIGEGHYIFGGGGVCPLYIAVKGFDFNPRLMDGALPNEAFTAVGCIHGSAQYVLLENNIFRGMAVVLDHGNTGAMQPADHFIIRNCAQWGSWGFPGHVQGAYVAGTRTLTIEDNVFWNSGWAAGVSRDASIYSGGLAGDEVFRHSLYIQDDVGAVIVRRNLIVDGAADGGQHRTTCLVQSNVYIDQPIGVNLGGGVTVVEARPDGDDLELSFCAFLGDADITTAFPRGETITTSNGRQGSVCRYNLIARSRNPLSDTIAAFSTGAPQNMSSYMLYDHNTIYKWYAAPNLGYGDGVTDPYQRYAAEIHASYENNLWDGAADGSNQNNAAVNFSHPYTAAELYTLLGFPSGKISFMRFAVAHPEIHLVRTALSLLQSGYNITLPPLGPLTVTVRLTLGIRDCSVIIGTRDGSVLTHSALPQGLSINSDLRMWSYDGTGSTSGSGSFLVTETLDSVSHTSTVMWSIAIPALLSSPSFASLTSNAVSLAVTTNTGSGTLYWIVTQQSLFPTPGALKRGFDGLHAVAPFSGSQTVSASGQITVSVVGLSASTLYYAFFTQEDSVGTLAVTVSTGAFTTSP